MSDIVLEIQALTRLFGAFTAVDSLTLSINTGEVFGLLGSNGAGKTTTIKMLATLLPPTSGEARVAGFSITTQECRKAGGTTEAGQSSTSNTSTNVAMICRKSGTGSGSRHDRKQKTGNHDAGSDKHHSGGQTHSDSW